MHSSDNVGGSCQLVNDSFEEFDRRLADGKRPVYEEGRDIMLPILFGLLFSMLGLIVLLFAQLTAYGLLLMTSYIVIALAGTIKHQRLVRKFSCLGLGRKTISRGVSFFDLHCAALDHLESAVTWGESRTNLLQERKEQIDAALQLAIKLGDKVEWPCSEIEQWKRLLHSGRMAGTVFAAFVSVVVLSALLSLVFSFSGLSFLIAVLMLLYCALPILGLMCQERRILFNRRGLDHLVCTESIKLRETIAQILTLLGRESRWPLVFHLAHDFEGLVYTGVRDTESGRFLLKEAVLYPVGGSGQTTDGEPDSYWVSER